MKQRILFTGDRGNLAREITRYLIDNDSMEVIDVDAGFRTTASRHHAWKELDVAHRRTVIDVVAEYKPNVVVHSAAVVNTDKCANDPENCIRVNLLGTHNVLEACASFGAKLIYFSTTATYDPAEPRPFVENTRQKPPTLYGITKYAGELLVSGQGKVPNFIVRPCFIFGDPPYDHSSQLCRVAVHTILKNTWPEKAGQTPIVTLDPASLKDYMRVEDFASAVVQLMQLNRYDGTTYNVSADRARPMGEFFDMLRDELGTLDLQWDSTADYMGDHVVRSELLRMATGWRPVVSAKSGIKDLARAAKKYVENCKLGTDVLLYQ